MDKSGHQFTFDFTPMTIKKLTIICSSEAPTVILMLKSIYKHGTNYY